MEPWVLPLIGAGASGVIAVVVSRLTATSTAREQFLIFQARTEGDVQRLSGQIQEVKATQAVMQAAQSVAHTEVQVMAAEVRHAVRTLDELRKVLLPPKRRKGDVEEDEG